MSTDFLIAIAVLAVIASAIVSGIGQAPEYLGESIDNRITGQTVGEALHCASVRSHVAAHRAERWPGSGCQEERGE